jgi:hypothetical protein
MLRNITEKAHPVPPVPLVDVGTTGPRKGLGDQIALPFKESKHGWRVVLCCLAIIVAVFIFVQLCDDSETGLEKWVWPESFWGAQNFSQEYCEEMRADHLLAENVNSTSNLIFVFFGLFIFALGRADSTRGSTDPDWSQRGRVVATPAFSYIYGLSLVFLGFTSFMFHAYRSDATWGLDARSMIVVLSPPIVLGPMYFIDIDHAKAGQLRQALMSFLVLWDVFVVSVATLFKGNIILVMTVQMALIVALSCAIAWFHTRSLGRERMQKSQSQWTWRCWYLLPLSLCNFLVAAYIRNAGSIASLAGECDRESWFQLHSVWHCMCALSLLLLYLCFRSEHMEHTKLQDDECDQSICDV